MSKLRLRLAALLLAPLALAAACGGGGNVPTRVGGSGGSPSSAATPSVVVTLHFISFEPSHVTIHAGQTVEWKWEDQVAHNVTFADFSSPTQVQGTWSHTFDTPGTYHYRCTIHATMSGEVTVLP